MSFVWKACVAAVVMAIGFELTTSRLGLSSALPPSGAGVYRRQPCRQAPAGWIAAWPPPTSYLALTNRYRSWIVYDRYPFPGLSALATHSAEVREAGWPFRSISKTTLRVVTGASAGVACAPDQISPKGTLSTAINDAQALRMLGHRTSLSTDSITLSPRRNAIATIINILTAGAILSSVLIGMGYLCMRLKER